MIKNKYINLYKNKIKMTKNNLLKIIGVIAPLALTACTDLSENQLGVRKTVGGEVKFHVGPSYEMLGAGTVEINWDGRRIISLPLDIGSKQSQHYTTKDGIINVDLTVNYCLGKSLEDRTKWFVKMENSETQFPRSVEGIVRDTIKKYSNAEILNEDLAKLNGKLPVFRQAQVDLYKSPHSDKHGVDKTCYAVWPGNISLLSAEVEADLNRQRKTIEKNARRDAQQYITKAGDLKAKVDGEYSKAISNLTPEVQDYLKTLSMVNAITSVAKEEGQEVDIRLFIE